MVCAPPAGLLSERMDARRLGKLVRGVLRPRTTLPLPDGFNAPRTVALRFRRICSQHSPAEALAAVGAPPEVDPANLRVVAYLLAHAALPDDSALELCVEQGVYGFQEWLAEDKAGR